MQQRNKLALDKVLSKFDRFDYNCLLQNNVKAVRKMHVSDLEDFQEEQFITLSNEKPISTLNIDFESNEKIRIKGYSGGRQYSEKKILREELNDA